MKHQNGLDQGHNVSSGLAVTDVGLDSADNKRLRALGLGRRLKDILHCRSFDIVTRTSARAMHSMTRNSRGRTVVWRSTRRYRVFWTFAPG